MMLEQAAVAKEKPIFYSACGTPDDRKSLF